MLCLISFLLHQEYQKKIFKLEHYIHNIFVFIFSQNFKYSKSTQSTLKYRLLQLTQNQLANEVHKSGCSRIQLRRLRIDHSYGIGLDFFCYFVIGICDDKRFKIPIFLNNTLLKDIYCITNLPFRKRQSYLQLNFGEPPGDLTTLMSTEKHNEFIYISTSKLLA